MPDGSEKFTFQEMLHHFQLSDIRLGGPVFDLDKLRWLNARYLRENYTPDTLLPVLEDWKLNGSHLKRVLAVVGSRMETLGDWGRMSSMFFSDSVGPSAELLTLKGMDDDGVKEVLQVSLWRLEELKEWTEEAVRAVFDELSREFGVKTKDFTAPFYTAMTGARVGPPLYAGMELLGSDLARRRIMAAIEALGGMSGKKLKALEKKHGRG